jgi:pimeloyl-ACP methyl ester carboxylesterase
VTEEQERDILTRCRSGLDRRKIDLGMYTTPALADDVADLATAMALKRINIYGVSYGTRWALEVMRRHPDLVRAAVLDGVYPPQVNGEQNEPEIVRRAFEQLYAECTADVKCRERHVDLRGAIEGSIEAAQAKPIELSLQLEDGPQSVRLDGQKFLMVLLHMMREGEAALIPETVAAVQRNDLRLLKMFAEDLESNDGGLLEQNAQQFDGLYNSIECRETWAAVDRAARALQVAPRSLVVRYQTCHRALRCAMNHSRAPSSPSPASAGKAELTPSFDSCTRSVQVSPPSCDDRAKTAWGPKCSLAPL